ncbi:tetratricopeptide repeat protein [Aeoliella sp. ICT_H6.2]|uniref:Tetratricopeptide repeat protein n=1 Tax=Aeoliella straminimaris TaxID=2954799 RepID=A0A9X2FHG8_9BACT|nr:tetratricopeptide repeat protein [Aeoliella straminimaris]MCO6046041.1 tetratricopeptide repeat protein [Aeoliella straminimaris]
MSRLEVLLLLLLLSPLSLATRTAMADETAVASSSSPAEEAKPEAELPETPSLDPPATGEPGEEDEQAMPDEQAEDGSAAEGESDNDEPSPGQADLDKATQLKLTASDGKQMNDVIQLLASAMKKGLDEENEAFAKQMLASTLMERGQGLAAVLLEQPRGAGAQQDPRWAQLRLIALSDLSNAVKLDPSEVSAWVLIGRLHQMPGGDPKAANQAYTKVIDLEDADAKLKAEAHARRATLQEDPDEQLADITGAIEADPDNGSYLLLRVRHHLATKQLDEALADVDKAIELSSDDYTAHELRGLVLREQGETEEAFKAFDRAGEINPESPMPYLQRAEMHSKLGDMEQAIDQASKAIDRAESNELGYLLRADFHLRNDQAEEGLADAERVLELRPNFPPAILLKARAYEMMGKMKLALGQLEELANATQDRADLDLQIALYALQLEMPRRAIEALDRAIEAQPDEAILYRYRGDSYLNIGKHAEAIADYEKAMELAPDDYGVLNNLAWTLATSPEDELRDGQRAVELATKACELSEFQAAHILSTLAAAHAEVGDFEKAKEWVQKGIELDDPENVEQLKEELAHYERGETIRERQEQDAGEREGAEETPAKDDHRELEKPSGSTPAPRRSIDF